MKSASTKVLFTISLLTTSFACASSSEDDAASTDPITVAIHRRRPPTTTTTGLTTGLIAATSGTGGAAGVGATTGGGGMGGAGDTGGAAGSSQEHSVLCFSQGAPNTICTGADHCCFNNYSAAHDGYCATDECPFGRIECDGPEDCPSGNVCCAERISDPSGIALAYVVACRAGSACPSSTWQLCHSSAPGTCGAGRSCQAAGPINAELPHELELCAP
jgi:hypothetical protein